MIFLSIPFAGKIILGVIVFFGVLSVIVDKNFCFLHWCYKDLKAFDPKDARCFCSKCIEDTMNPKLKCSCGWKGRLEDCEEHTVDQDRVHHYSCPDCEIEVRI